MLTASERADIGYLSTREEVVKYLQAHGFAYAGEGSFADVFTREHDQTALKVSKPRGEFDGGLAYAKWLITTKPQNPALPRVERVWEAHRLNGEDYFYLVEMEALGRIPPDADAQADYNAIATGLDPSLWGNGAYASTYEREAAREAGGLIRKALIPQWGLDLSFQNFMYRGTQPVITDPIAFSVA